MKKIIISLCTIAVAAVSFTSCQKETAPPSNNLNAGTVSNIIKHGYTGGTGTGDSTKVTTQP